MTAHCCQCDIYWSWTAHRGTKLKDLACTNCGRQLKGVGNPQDRVRFPIGMSRELRRRYCLDRIALVSEGHPYRSRYERELRRVEVQILDAATEVRA